MNEKIKNILGLAIHIGIFTAIFLLVILFPPHNIYAQGTYTCTYTTTCQLQSVNCDAGCTPYDLCVGRTPSNCMGTYTCGCAGAIIGGGNCGPNELYTALGCINTQNMGAFLSFALPWSIGIAGGVAFLLIIYAGFLITTSGGNPQRLGAGKELLTAAFSGLILLIFAVFLLRLIGKDILKFTWL